MRVADLMTSAVADCSPEESIRTAAKRMVDCHCGCLPITVCDGGEKRLVGIVTDRDLVCRAVAVGLDPEHTEVGRCMSFPVQTITRDADLGECADRFTILNIRRLVVVDAQNRCLGIISRADLQRFVTDTATTEGRDQQPTTPQVANVIPSVLGNQPSTAASSSGGFDPTPPFNPAHGNPEVTT